MNLEPLLEPIEGSCACGVELDYNPRYLALENSMLGKPERQYGSTLIPAEEPDWSKVLEESQALLGKSKDFRLALILTRALTRLRGVEGACRGLAFCLELARTYWDEAYPLLEFDGEPDPLPRGNALAGLGAQSGLIGDLRACQLNTQQMGSFDLATLERIATSREDAKDAELRREQLEQLLRDEAQNGNPLFAALRELKALALALDRLCQEQLGSENAPSFQALHAWLELLHPEALNPLAAPAPDDAQPQEASAAAPVNELPSGGVRTRAEAILMLDAVCAFLEQSEPASPAPLLIKRARKLIGQDFLSILRELAPDGLAQAELIAGITQRG